MTSHPLRIQRKRAKGWRLPHGATCVTRPGKFGNPFETAAEFQSVMELIERGWVDEPKSESWQRMVWIHQNVSKLRGFKLACWCPIDAECHADILANLANR